MRVVELTGSQRTSMREIADVIANDQGLSGKVLKTVNSSFYGLSKPCTTINQAIVMLGLSAVKTLALGFSLVSTLGKGGNAGFDYPSYWRRGLLTGVAAKCIAHETKIGREEECFLAGLLQDVGMIAMYEALGDDYLECLREAGEDHRALIKSELAHLEVSHADIGAMLVGRWKLPPELAIPIKFHERPQGSPQDYIDLCQAVGLGNIAADVLCAPEAAVVLKKYYAKAQEWFDISPGKADELMKKISVGAKEVAKLLEVDAAGFNDPDAVRKRADEQLLAIAVPLAPEPGDTEGHGAGASSIDPVSTLPNRMVFSQNLVAVVEQFNAGGGPFGIAVLAIDDWAGIEESQGSDYADALLHLIAGHVKKHLASSTAVLCALERGQYGVLLSGTDRLAATRLVENLKIALASTTLSVKPAGLIAVDMVVTISAGLVTLDNTTRGRFSSIDSVQETAGRALASAQRAGSNVLRVYIPKANAA